MPTAQDVLKRTGASIGLDFSGSVSSDEKAFLLDWMNEALRQFLLDTKAYVKSTDVTILLPDESLGFDQNAFGYGEFGGTGTGMWETEPGSGDYTLPNEVLVVNQIRVTTYGQVIPLAPIDPEEMLWRRRYPGAIPLRYYSMQGQNLLMFYPKPNPLDEMTFYYVPRPTLVDETNWDQDIAALSGISEEFHHIPEYWVLWRAGDFSDDASSQNGMTYYQLYNSEVRKVRGKIRRLQGRKRPFARAGRRQRLKYYPAYPSQDVGD